MDDTRTIFGRDITIAGYDMSLFARLFGNGITCKRIKRLISTSLESLPFELLENLTLALNVFKYFFYERLRKDVDFTTEFVGRSVTKSGQLGEPNTSLCIVKKKPFGGKRLMFVFDRGKHEAHAYLNKSTVKELRTGLKIDKKLHPKHHR